MSENPEISLDMLLDVNVTLSVELGRTKMTIKDLMALNKGSIISMAKEVTEPMDLMVNGTLIARGDVVESEGQFGLRLLDIVSTDERLEPLQEVLDHAIRTDRSSSGCRSCHSGTGNSGARFGECATATVGRLFDAGRGLAGDCIWRGRFDGYGR